jgi:hypothetical protein
MQHVSSHSLQAESDGESVPSGADDDDLPQHTRVNDQEACDSVVHLLPSEGYHIFNLRPPTPARVGLPEHLNPNILITSSYSPCAIAL